MFNIQPSLLFAVATLLLGLASAELHQNSDILINKTAIQLKFFNNSINLVGSGSLKPVRYRLYRVDVRSGHRTTDQVVYSRLVPDQSIFQAQPPTGLLYNASEMVTFATNLTDLSNTGLVVEVLTEDIKLSGYLSPFEIYETSGYRNVTLLDPHSNIAGEVKVSYLVIRPISGFNPLAGGYISTENLTFAGHRGTGRGVRFDLPVHYIENTIAAFNYACSNGAQMIELDVHLNKNGIPIIYHDFDIHTYIVDRFDSHSNVSVKVPVKDFDSSQIKHISTNFMPHLNHTKMESQSFETLEDVLKDVNPECGINVEIKYPQLYQTLHYESEPGVELNKYVDTILKVLYEHGGNRSMVITSFHVDLCVMVQLKQNKYRVGLLTSGYAIEWNKHFNFYYDPRSISVENGVAFAQSFYLKGLSLLADQVTKTGEYNYIDYVTSRNLSLILWFGTNPTKDSLCDLHKRGVELLIFDKIDKIIGHSNHHC